MKTCYKCNKNKNINLFYKDRSKKDGHKFICMECDAKKASEYYTAHHNTNRSNYRKAWIKASKNKDVIKDRARNKLRYAVKAGKIIKPEYCQSIYSDVCEGKLHAHHFLGYDSEHWKDVIWLCKKHHDKYHRVQKMKIITAFINS